MIRLLRGSTIVCALITFAMAGWDAEAHWFGTLSCSTPATGVCTAGATCTDYGTGNGCTLSGAGSWSVCVNTMFSSCGWSTGCSGTFTATGRGVCICYGNQFAASGC